MKKLALMLFLAACGDQTVTVGGEVIVKHTVDLLVFEKYYQAYCESLYSSRSAVDQCVQDKMADLVNSLSENGAL